MNDTAALTGQLVTELMRRKWWYRLTVLQLEFIPVGDDTVVEPHKIAFGTSDERKQLSKAIQFVREA